MLIKQNETIVVKFVDGANTIWGIPKHITLLLDDDSMISVILLFSMMKT